MSEPTLTIDADGHQQHTYPKLNPADLPLRLAANRTGRPIVVERRHGAGKVTLVAPDLWSPPFLHAPHSTRMVEALLVERVESEPRSHYLFQELAAVPAIATNDRT